MQADLRVDNLSLYLPSGQCLVKELSFTIGSGEVLALMGPSGSGKSSILNWLTGTADSRLNAEGTIWLGAEQLDGLATEKRRLGLMLQQDYLFPHMSVGENLLFGLRGGTVATRQLRILKSLKEAGLNGMEQRDPATLSGGQRARVSLIRTLLSDPHALLLDEPFSGLDTALREQIRRFTWTAASRLPVLLVTHDLADVPEGAKILTIGGPDPATDLGADPDASLAHAG